MSNEEPKNLEQKESDQYEDYVNGEIAEYGDGEIKEYGWSGLREVATNETKTESPANETGLQSSSNANTEFAEELDREFDAEFTNELEHEFEEELFRNEYNYNYEFANEVGETEERTENEDLMQSGIGLQNEETRAELFEEENESDLVNEQAVNEFEPTFQAESELQSESESEDESTERAAESAATTGLGDSIQDTEFAAEATPRQGLFNPIAEPDITGADQERRVIKHNEGEESLADGRGMGIFALVLSIISLFVWPAVLGPASVLLGFMAWGRGNRGLGIWSIVIGLVSFLAYIVFLPLFY